MASKTFVALFRGVNVGGRRAMPMVELRALAAGIGLEGARTLIQSGNLVFRANRPCASVEERLSREAERRFGFSCPAIVRGRRAFEASLAGDPFPEESISAPDHVFVAFARGHLPGGAIGCASSRDPASGSRGPRGRSGSTSRPGSPGRRSRRIASRGPSDRSSRCGTPARRGASPNSWPRSKEGADPGQNCLR